MMAILPALTLALAVAPGPGVPAMPGLLPAAQPAAQAPAVDRPSAVDVTALGVSIARIRRELRELPPMPARKNSLRLNYYIQVYGSMPSWRIFQGVDLSSGGAVRFGGMTHAEFLQVTTPQEFHVPSGSIPVPKKKQR